MKIAITGHTSGIGKAISDLLKKSGHTVIGLSRSTGFDLSYAKQHGLKYYISEMWKKRIFDCDVFINNAHYEFMQVELLYAIYEVWKSKNKTIINISSVSGDKSKFEVHQYQIYKIALDNACRQLETMGKCKIVNVRPGWVDTPSIKDYKKYVSIGIKILQPKDIAKVILYILGQPKTINIKSISIEPWYK